MLDVLQLFPCMDLPCSSAPRRLAVPPRACPHTCRPAWHARLDAGRQLTRIARLWLFLYRFFCLALPVLLSALTVLCWIFVALTLTLPSLVCLQECRTLPPTPDLPSPPAPPQPPSPAPPTPVPSPFVSVSRRVRSQSPRWGMRGACHQHVRWRSEPNSPATRPCVSRPPPCHAFPAPDAPWMLHMYEPDPWLA